MSWVNADHMVVVACHTIGFLTHEEKSKIVKEESTLAKEDTASLCTPLIVHMNNLKEGTYALVLA